MPRLLRRNPTEAERLLWHAIVNDRRFAGRGFKRQVPIGQHVCDFVSFPLKCVVDILPAEEAAEATQARAIKRSWLAERGYRMFEFQASDIEREVAAVLETLDTALQ